jgi:hypothetical protein
MLQPPVGEWGAFSCLVLALGLAAPLAACSGDELAGLSPDGSLEPLALGAVPLADTEVPPSLGAPDVTLEEPGFQHIFFPAGDLDGDGLDEWVTLHWLPAVGSFLILRYGGPRPANAGEAMALSEGGARLLVDRERRTEVVTAVGDLDGDGYGEVLVSPARCHPRPAQEVYLLYGGPERLEGDWPLSEVGVRLEIPRSTWPDTAPGDCVGGTEAMALPLGDFDGDGLDDLAVVIRRDKGAVPVPEVSGSDVNWGPATATYFFYGSPRRLASGARLLDADAIVHSATDTTISAAGDANGDGRADLLFATGLSIEPLMYWVPGRGARWSGELDVAGIGTPLAADLQSFDPGTAGSDVDGDGTSDVFLRDKVGTTHLFYGRPRLFDDGIDFSAADATFARSTPWPAMIVDLGDRDADGDREIASWFHVSAAESAHPGPARDFASLSGSRQRWMGRVQFPIQAVLDAHPGTRRFDEEDRYLGYLRSAGDLDGDGAADLLVTSLRQRPDDGCTLDVNRREPRLHIFYGSPAAASAP